MRTDRTRRTVVASDPPLRGASGLRTDVAVFVVVAIVAAWVPWGRLIVSGREPFSGDGLATVAWFLGGHSPILAALVVSLRGGRGGVRRLLDGLLRWRLGRWYLVLLLPVAVALVAVSVAVGVGPPSFDLAGWGFLLLVPLLFANAVVVGGLEEIGWRGYLLPRLQTRLPALGASLVIATVWSVWHAPLFLIGSTTQTSMPVVWFTLQAFGLSIILTWVYNGSGGSLLLAVLFHAAVNAGYTAVVQGLAPASLDSFTAPAAVLTVVVGLCLLRWYGADDIAARPRVTWPRPGGRT